MYKWYAKASRKRARQMVCRQSDGRIVPMMARSPLGIIAGGKSRTWRFPLSTAIRNKLNSGARHRDGECDIHFRISTSGNCARRYEIGIIVPADICLITVLSGS